MRYRITKEYSRFRASPQAPYGRDRAETSPVFSARRALAGTREIANILSLYGNAYADLARKTVRIRYVCVLQRLRQCMASAIYSIIALFTMQYHISAYAQTRFV